MPALACPGSVHRYSKLPFFVKTNVSDVDCPGCNIFVTFPTQAFVGAFGTGLVQTLKSCTSLPAFVTLNVTVPIAGTDFFESLNASSDGFPAVTLMTVMSLARDPTVGCSCHRALQEADGGHARTREENE